MFDLITGKVQHVPSTPAIPILVSTSIQGTTLAVIALMSFLVATRELPAVPDILAFVAEMPAAASPPPPSPPRQTVRTVEARKTTLPPNAFAAPIEAPPEIVPEPAGSAIADVGVPGGVEGGIAGGIVGSLPAVVEGPPPPPPPALHEPVRIGGQLQAPALLKRVAPVYPTIAQAAAIDGVVILDAIVDERGHIQSLKVLRGHPLLAKAAIAAVEQWEYEPLKLNGTPTAFQLTVSLWFHAGDKPKRLS